MCADSGLTHLLSIVKGSIDQTQTSLAGRKHANNHLFAATHQLLIQPLTSFESNMPQASRIASCVSVCLKTVRSSNFQGPWAERHAAWRRWAIDYHSIYCTRTHTLSHTPSRTMFTHAISRVSLSLLSQCVKRASRNSCHPQPHWPANQHRSCKPGPNWLKQLPQSIQA